MDASGCIELLPMYYLWIGACADGVVVGFVCQKNNRVCTEFVDANGKVYYDWIPAIRLFSEEGG